MFNKWRKISAIAVLLLTTRSEAQVDWDKINLVGTQAKILGTTIADQNQQLIIQTFETKEGKISVLLPPLSSASTISGTVFMEPAGRTKDSSKNLIALQSYKLDLGNTVIPAQRGSFRIQLPNENGSIPLQLKTNEGQLIKTEQLQITKATAYGNSLTISPYIVSGDAAVVTGKFDGDISNTTLNINGERSEVFAESSSQLFFRTPVTFTGNVAVALTENGITQTSKTNVLKLELAADKTDLRRGQQTQIHIKITGLEGLSENVPVMITNASPSVITLEGGDKQYLNVEPGNKTTGGVFTTSRIIQSVKTGGFSVSVSITSFSAPLR